MTVLTKSSEKNEFKFFLTLTVVLKSKLNWVFQCKEMPIVFKDILLSQTGGIE